MVSATGRNKRQLTLVFVFTTVYLVVEVIGGLVTGSLALLADAGHMLTDVGGLGLALFAIRFAERPATPARTYGYYRAEILSAVANAVVLIGFSLYILYEAYQRFRNPPAIEGLGMLGVAAVGLLVNIVGMMVLRRGSTESLNLKGAYFEVLSDMLSSLGVIAAGLIMWTTKWYYADPLFSAGIGLFILPRTWTLLQEAVGVAPGGNAIRRQCGQSASRAGRGRPSRLGLRRWRLWSLTSGLNAMSAHAILGAWSGV